MLDQMNKIHMDSRGVRICTFANTCVAGSKWTIDYVSCDATPDQLRQIAAKIEELNSK